MTTPTDDNQPIDRWLRSAPWAAAILVGLCVVVFLIRVSQRAGAGNERDAGIARNTPAPVQNQNDDARPAKIETATDPVVQEHATATNGAPAGRPPPLQSFQHLIRQAQKVDLRYTAPVQYPRPAIHDPRRRTRASASRAKNMGRMDSKSVASTPDVLAGQINRATAEAGRAYTSFFGVEAEGPSLRLCLRSVRQHGRSGEPSIAGGQG